MDRSFVERMEFTGLVQYQEKAGMAVGPHRLHCFDTSVHLIFKISIFKHITIFHGIIAALAAVALGIVMFGGRYD